MIEKIFKEQYEAVADHYNCHDFLDDLFQDYRLEAKGSGRYHHSYPGGNIVHCAQMLTILEKVKHMLDIDIWIVKLAIIIHDSFKGIDDGKNHIPKICDYVVEKCPINIDISHLVHLVASHHGRQGWGALEEPNTREAWCLHLLDMMCSQVITE